MNNQAQKVCPHCSETILGAAKVCPHCRQWLSLRSFRHPLILTGLGTLSALALLLLFLTVLRHTFNPPPYYSDFPGALQVLESAVHWGELDGKPRIYLTGLVTNQSSISWKNVEFECRFMDDSGALVDAHNGRGYFTILPQDDRAFRLSVWPARPMTNYTSHKLSVSTAQNTRTSL